jgi:methionyl-tRNA formyltransferase
MGTPEFAVESLKALVENGYNVVGVVTTPDRAVGKHQSVLQPSAVKQYALSQNLPLLQPEKLKDEKFLEKLKALKADLQIVVAFRMLPESVWAMPRFGTFNLHASLLPQYRGAAPINWAIINGETETGVTTFLLDREIDTGKILFQEKTPISETDTAETVHDRLMASGSKLVLKTVDAISSGAAQGIDQKNLIRENTTLHPAPKIFKETCKINFAQPVKKIYDFVRGLSPYPAAWASFEEFENLKNFNLKVFKAEPIVKQHNLPAGAPLTDGKTFLDIAAIDGFVRLKDIQQAGKRRMSVEEFLRGNGKIFSERIPNSNMPSPILSEIGM